MHVGLILEQTLAPVPGGTGRYAAELAAALSRTAGDGDALTTWTAWHRDVTPSHVEPGVRAPHRLPLGRRALALAWECGLPPAPRGVDVLHAPTLLFPPRRQPLVVSLHDTVPWTHPETLTAHGVRWHRAMAKRAVQVADAVAVPTEAVRADLHDVLPALRGRVCVLGGGFAPALAVPPGPDVMAEVAERYCLSETYVLSLATLEPRKGLDVLVEALGELKDRAPALVVVGQPAWGEVDVARLAGSAGLPADKLRVLGRIPDPDLAVVLRRAAMLVVPSRAEGFGLPVAEAMAAGTPMICSDVPALVEVAGDAALVVPRGDPHALAEAIDGLARDPATRRALAEAGLARAPQFTWDGVARRAWALYRDLGERGAAAASCQVTAPQP